MGVGNWIKGLFVGGLIGISSANSVDAFSFIDQNRLYDNSWSESQIDQRKAIWKVLNRELSDHKFHLLRVAFDNLDRECSKSERQLLSLKKRLKDGDQPPYSVKPFIKEGNDNLSVIRDFMNKHKSDLTKTQIEQLIVLSKMYADELKSNCDEMVNLMKPYQKHVY